MATTQRWKWVHEKKDKNSTELKSKPAAKIQPSKNICFRPIDVVVVAVDLFYLTGSVIAGLSNHKLVFAVFAQANGSELTISVVDKLTHINACREMHTN